MIKNPFSERRSGILLHPSSLPGNSLDDYLRWLDFLAEAGQRVWQILPLGIPVMGRSPYQCQSAFAVNMQLMETDQTSCIPDNEEFALWQQQESFWLADFALFSVLKQTNNGQPWHAWPVGMRDREASVINSLIEEHHKQIQEIAWQQFQLSKFWNKVKQAAVDRDILIFGDMPIFIAHDSADAWSCPQRFLLDDAGQLLQVTGVPPDYFSDTGQRWGNPHYDWDYMQNEDFSWWINRLLYHFQWFDLVRIDHFRGLESVWMIEADAETAENGYWQKVPGARLLSMLKKKLGNVSIVAEDLGIITPEVTALRKQFDLPGMVVLQFAFDAFDDNPHKPKNISSDHIAYTGTHDNDTTAGWFTSLLPHEQQFVRDTLGLGADADIVRSLIGEAVHSKAIISIIPMQDVLGLDSSARMNIPGDEGDHWKWELDWTKVSNDTSTYLREITQDAGRR